MRYISCLFYNTHIHIIITILGNLACVAIKNDEVDGKPTLYRNGSMCCTVYISPLVDQ